jgi:predicted nucleic acid-binding protein
VKHSFIIDENVIAQTRNLELAALTIEFFTLVKKNCHKVVLDRTLLKKLNSWLDRRDSKLAKFFPLGPTFMRSVLTDSKKRKWIDTIPEKEERKYIHDQDDWYLVDLAVTCKNAHYVSTGDKKTRKSFNRAEFSAIGIDGITVSKAIQLAKDQ